MLINERMSGQASNNIPDLPSRFQAKLSHTYRLDTFFGFLSLLRYAIQHLYFSPSAYLSKKSREGLDFYVSNVSQLRKSLLNIEFLIKQGSDLVSHDDTWELTDGTVIEFRIQHSAEARFFYLKNDQSEWELQPFSPQEFIAEIERDILNNPACFDPRLVASCKLNTALKTIEDLGRILIEERREHAKSSVKTVVNYYGADDLMPRLISPNDPHHSRLVQDIENIIDHLIQAGTYDDDLHPDEPSFRTYDFFNLRVVIECFISDNLDHLLLGNITAANRDAVRLAIRLLEKLATNDLSEVVNNKLAFIRAVSDQDLSALPLNSPSRSLLANYFKVCQNQTDHIDNKNLALAQKIIDQFFDSLDPQHPLPDATLNSLRQLRDDLSEILSAIDNLDWETENDSDEAPWTGQINSTCLQVSESSGAQVNIRISTNLQQRLASHIQLRDPAD